LVRVMGICMPASQELNLETVLAPVRSEEILRHEVCFLTRDARDDILRKNC
jgi:hypothetical protein